MNNKKENPSLNAHQSNNELPVILKRYSHWFILSIIVFLLAAFTYQWLHQPLYNVSAVIEIQNSPGKQAQFLSQTNENNLQHFNNTIHSAAFIKKMEEQTNAALLDEELKDLQITTGNKTDELAININTFQPQQASLFLNRLYFAYTNEGKKTTAIRDFNGRLESLSRFIARQTKQAQLLKSRTGQFPDATQTLGQAFESKKQLDILKTLKPYLRDADRQFQLIPTTFTITDPYINHLILQFNDAQNDKQSLLSNGPGQPAISAANQKITVVKNLLMTAIDSAGTKNTPAGHQGIAARNNRSIKDSLSNLQIVINDSIRSYAVLLGKKHGVIGEKPRRSLMTSVTKVDDNAAGIYVIAVLSGILLPLAVFSAFSTSFKNKGISSITGELDIQFLGTISSPAGTAELARNIVALLPVGNKIILLTAAAVSDKTLTALEIAFYLTEKKHKLVIVDLDFEIDSSENESPALQQGVIDYITGKTTSLADILMPTPYPAISRIEKGGFSQHHASPQVNDIIPGTSDEDDIDRVLNSVKLDELIRHLTEGFDYILLKTSSLIYPANVLPLLKTNALKLVILNTATIPDSIAKNLNTLVVKHCIKDIYIVKNQ